MGINTVIINGKFHELLVHYFNRFNIVAIERIPLELLHQICKLTSANIVYNVSEIKETGTICVVCVVFIPRYWKCRENREFRGIVRTMFNIGSEYQ